MTSYIMMIKKTMKNYCKLKLPERLEFGVKINTIQSCNIIVTWNLTMVV